MVYLIAARIIIVFHLPLKDLFEILYALGLLILDILDFLVAKKMEPEVDTSTKWDRESSWGREYLTGFDWPEEYWRAYDKLNRTLCRGVFYAKEDC